MISMRTIRFMVVKSKVKFSVTNRKQRSAHVYNCISKNASDQILSISVNFKQYRTIIVFIYVLLNKKLADN